MTGDALLELRLAFDGILGRYRRMGCHAAGNRKQHDVT
jgi:hypothetical protein